MIFIPAQAVNLSFRHAVDKSKEELATPRYSIIIWGKANSFSIYATIENVDLRKSLGDHMALVDVISTGDKTETLEVFTQHIQEGFDLQLEGLHQSQ